MYDVYCTWDLKYEFVNNFNIFNIRESILITYLKYDQLYTQNKSFQQLKNIKDK